MCGQNRMAGNATYSFWDHSVDITSAINGMKVALPYSLIAAVLMMFGILVIAMNPLDLFRKRRLDSMKSHLIMLF